MNPGSELGSAAVRIDHAAGTKEELAFSGPPGAMRFGSTHVPLAGSSTGALICSSLRAEFETNYRREVLLGRALAAAGIAAHRFQYLGTGNSDGATEEVDLGKMFEDAAAARDWLVARTGVARIAFIGARLGAIVAASAAASQPGSPLVLWEPVVDTRRYFRELFRARRMWAANQPGIEDTSERALDELRRRPIDVLGYPIDLALYESVVGIPLEGVIGNEPRPVLVVQMGGSSARPEHAALVTRLSKRGFAAELEVVADEESWWLEPPGERQEKRLLRSSQAVEATVEWVRARSPRAGGAA